MREFRHLHRNLTKKRGLRSPGLDIIEPDSYMKTKARVKI
ncbi:hypothetical protein M595_4503 [Lyngbya aestuarii BL J]|uniref:Uncharacterized protein n=1 Tax=Lyngbya aestuarii BL J TaxID=1348334 RepID=U7QCI3_9CYAN|nr:hypothetical protein M595_4503 [Lyngbya aestuarii BL J]